MMILFIVSLPNKSILDNCTIVVVSHTKHSGVDDGTFFYFPQSTFVAMGGSENVANGTSFEITQKDMKSSRCWEGNVTLFDTGDRNDGAEVFGRRQTDYKAGQWAARDMLQLKECGSKCSQASSGKFDIHCVSFISMTTYNMITNMNIYQSLSLCTWFGTNTGIP